MYIGTFPHALRLATDAVVVVVVTTVLPSSLPLSSPLSSRSSLPSCCPSRRCSRCTRRHAVFVAAAVVVVVAFFSVAILSLQAHTFCFAVSLVQL